MIKIQDGKGKIGWNTKSQATCRVVDFEEASSAAFFPELVLLRGWSSAYSGSGLL